MFVVDGLRPISLNRPSKKGEKMATKKKTVKKAKVAKKSKAKAKK